MRLAKPTLFLVMFAALFATACGKKNASESGKANSQVVAKVNGEEITIYQVNFQLSQLGALSQDQAKAASKQVLARLVEQEILKQQAEQDKLDKDPVILQALDASKKQLLAQAYMERTLAKAPKPSSSEVDGFYKDHPELFSNRRIYSLQELVVGVSKDKSAEVEAAIKSIKGINDVAIWLRDHGYAFNVNSNAKAAEQIPMELLKSLQQIKTGEMLIVPTASTLSIIHLAAIQEAPITREKATPVIEQYFLNQTKATMAKKELAALNDKAKVEFQGMFADMKKSDLTQPQAAATASPSAESTVQEKPAAQKPSEAKPAANAKSMDKGLSGL